MAGKDAVEMDRKTEDRGLAFSGASKQEAGHRRNPTLGTYKSLAAA
jgi:hypothetical protein